MSNNNTPEAKRLVAALQSKGVKLGHVEALDVVAQLQGHRNHQSSPAAKSGPAADGKTRSAKALRSLSASITWNKARARDVEALIGLRTMERDFKANGLADGLIKVSRESGQEEGFYDENSEVLRAATGSTVQETAENLECFADLKLLCDEMERCGADISEYGDPNCFEFEVDMAKFRKEWVLPVEQRLKKAGVTLDL